MSARYLDSYILYRCRIQTNDRHYKTVGHVRSFNFTEANRGGAEMCLQAEYQKRGSRSGVTGGSADHYRRARECEK